MKFKDRIVELRRVPASQLRANPKNWRKHPQEQIEALTAVLSEVGFVDANIGRIDEHGEIILLDGHLRGELAENDDVPVLIVDVTEAEGDTILATLDPLASMAKADKTKFRELVNTLTISEKSLDSLFNDIMGLRPANGELLAVANITVAEPETKVRKGQTWTLGEHKLCCCEVFTEWQKWTKYLKGKAIFAPYPGPFVVLTIAAETSPLVMVQPDTYIAGHIVDKYVTRFGNKGVKSSG